MPWMGDRAGRQHLDHVGSGVKNMSELIAPLCATQAASQAFFCIPARPSMSNARERSTTVVVTMIKGSVCPKQIEDEFNRILSGAWRWTVRRIADNQFSVRFPSAQLIRDWERFNPVKMRTTKAKLQIDAWNGLAGVKAELQQGWFRIRGIPYDMKSEETAEYAGSLVGATVEVDKASLSRNDYARVKLAVRDLGKVPDTVEGAIVPYMYDFQYEREVEVDQATNEDSTMVHVDQGDPSHAAKKPKTDGQIPVQQHNQSQNINVMSGKSDLQQMKTLVKSIPSLSESPRSATPKMGEGLDISKQGNMSGECSKSQCKSSQVESRGVSFTNSAEERVQGSSRNNITYSEEDGDLLSEGAQGSRSDDPVSMGKVNSGMRVISDKGEPVQPSQKQVVIYEEKEKAMIPYKEGANKVGE
jgi:hypothetical protein